MKTRGMLVGLALAATVTLGGSAVTIARADVMPDATELANDLSGLWHTSWGSESCDVTLRQQGTQITGSYVTTGAPPGAVSGTLNGNRDADFHH